MTGSNQPFPDEVLERWFRKGRHDNALRTKERRKREKEKKKKLPRDICLGNENKQRRTVSLFEDGNVHVNPAWGFIFRGAEVYVRRAFFVILRTEGRRLRVIYSICSACIREASLASRSPPETLC